MKKFSILLLALFATVARCQEAIVDEDSSVSESEEGNKEKRGISLNLGSGLEGYSYLGPSSRGLYRGYSGYTPMTDYGYDGVNYGVGGQNFAGGYQGSYHGYNSPYGNYPYGYRGSNSFPTSYSYLRQYHIPVSTNPYGGIGTVGPYGGAYMGGYNGGINRFGYDNSYGGGAYGSSGFF
ncbi:hypothetical protein PVAND_011037 [Polypedilum vanderplanki]|uniref:Prisilkin-39-like n=1 Tax=Polypedilum vanderplanki TaxID=319348 RepID=A0A9J6CI47_POLVA|nr:hypothetical protein PVAND_011037 [Polypedilum vanderplanki]